MFAAAYIVHCIDRNVDRLFEKVGVGGGGAEKCLQKNETTFDKL